MTDTPTTPEAARAEQERVLKLPQEVWEFIRRADPRLSFEARPAHDSVSALSVSVSGYRIWDQTGKPHIYDFLWLQDIGEKHAATAEINAALEQIGRRWQWPPPSAQDPASAEGANHE